MEPIRHVASLSVTVCLVLCTIFDSQTIAQNTKPKAPPTGVIDHVTVPLLIDRIRPYIDVTFHLANGSRRNARFLVDSGGGGFLLSEPLARDIGLHWGAIIHDPEEGDYANPDSPPSAFVGEFPLELNPKRVLVMIGHDTFLPGHAEGLFPGHLLSRYHVVFDYPKETFTLALPGVLTPKGDMLPMPVSSPSGFPRTEIEVAGVKYGLLIDTGASFTMVSEVLLKSWGKDHNDWPRYPGAYGEAKTLGGAVMETMFVPEGLWGTHQLKELGVVSEPEGTFEKYMSGMMTAPIIGSLAGNVLRHYRVELDYPNEKLYISEP